MTKKLLKRLQCKRNSETADVEWTMAFRTDTPEHMAIDFAVALAKLNGVKYGD